MYHSLWKQIWSVLTITLSNPSLSQGCHDPNFRRAWVKCGVKVWSRYTAQKGQSTSKSWTLCFGVSLNIQSFNPFWIGLSASGAFVTGFSTISSVYWLSPSSRSPEVQTQFDEKLKKGTAHPFEFVSGAPLYGSSATSHIGVTPPTPCSHNTSITSPITVTYHTGVTSPHNNQYTILISFRQITSNLMLMG